LEASDALTPWINVEEGKMVQRKVRKKLTANLEGIQLGIVKYLVSESLEALRDTGS
jgi:hypothetical protein